MKITRDILVFLVRVYRWVISPAKTVLFGPLGRCRYEPSCSAYALEALQVHGSGLGMWLAAKRICRCHPWGGAGHDPVPGKEEFGQSKDRKFDSAGLSMSSLPASRESSTLKVNLVHGS